MILGIDHIAVSTMTLHESARALEAAGFERAFIEHDLPNGVPKRDFLSEYQPLHSIALYRPQHGIAIEITQHATTTRRQGPYHLLLDGVLSLPSSVKGEASASVEWEDVWQSAGWSEIDRLDSFMSTVRGTATSDTASPRIRAVGLCVSDIEKSVRFWRDGLRFRTVSKGNTRGGIRWERLSFRSVQPNWCIDLVLVESKPITSGQTMLDDQGATCLALITTDITSELARVGRADIHSFELDVAGKRLAVAILRGPNDELIELIQPPADDASSRKKTSTTPMTAQANA